jgi:predicted DNA-binding protein
MEHKPLQAWMKTVVENSTSATESFETQFSRDPAGVLEAGGFNLHDTYRERLNRLSEKDRRTMSKFFRAVADSSPADLRRLYAVYAEQVEDFYQWEGAREPGVRGWLI